MTGLAVSPVRIVRLLCTELILLINDSPPFLLRARVHFQIHIHFRPQQLGREERSERATSRMARAKEPGGEERMASRSSSSHEAQV
jgi:hypothetical protein